MTDFNKNCEAFKSNPLPLCGIPIYYHRCGRCGFIFTTAFDEFTNEDFLATIYNAEYLLVDPEFADRRPRGNAALLNSVFTEHKNISILDYGGGNGRLAALLRSNGFSSVDAYDPFITEFSVRPKKRYDCVVCFEVVEHSNRPLETFSDMDSFLEADGLLLFSTLLQPADIDQAGVGWWYIAPRNGHVSIFSAAALAAALSPVGLHLGVFNAGMHAACRRVPAFARHFAASARAVAPAALHR